ncbi:MAG: diguanylate cyclase [Pyrinomonadaceae bacterium]|nr:diguanylate cyclase [Pyrinomonadaceae bacterium]
MNLHLAFLSATIIGSVLILLYLLTRPDTRGSNSLLLLCVASITWMAGETIGVFSETLRGQFTGEVIKFASVVSIPLGLLIFVARHCGRPMPLKRILYLSIVPAISYLFVLTSAWHQLFFAEIERNTLGGPLIAKYGPIFWFVHTPYSFSLILICLGMLLFEMNRVSQRFRTQMILIFISICIPVSINFVNLAGIIKGVNLNPLGLLCFLAVSVIAIYRYQLLRGNPIAYETVFKTSKDGVIIVNQDSVIMDVNPAVASGLGKKPGKLIGKNVNDVFASWKPFGSKYEKILESYDELELQIKGSRRYFAVTKKPVSNLDGEVIGKIITIRNITTQKLHQISLETLAFHDPLTMLGNRRKFEEEFDYAVGVSSANKSKFAILYFDLNNFKMINDTMGHKIGDELLKYVAARIASILRKPDVVARLGGDEFAAILHNATEPGVKIAVERIVENTRAPFRIKGQTLIAELSVGAAFYPTDGEEMNKLLGLADNAMFRAKSQGGGLAISKPHIDSARIQVR